MTDSTHDLAVDLRALQDVLERLRVAGYPAAACIERVPLAFALAHAQTAESVDGVSVALATSGRRERTGEAFVAALSGGVTLYATRAEEADALGEYLRREEKRPHSLLGSVG